MGWTLLVATHAVAATLALVLGAAQLFRRHYGDRMHRWVGRSWVGLMAFVALSSFFIRDIRPGNFSWIHVLSVITLVSLVAGTRAIRRGDLVRHAITMVMTYLGMIGALIGVVAVPTRLVPSSFQADWPGMTLLTVGIGGAALGGVAVMSLAVRRLGPRRNRGRLAR